MSASTSLAPVAERLRASVVQLRHGGSAGAGVAWGPDGTIVTNAHVVHDGRVTVVSPDGGSVPGAVVRSDPRRDLALIRADVDLPPVRPADPAELRPGALVFAVGHPMGVTEAVSAGVFQAVGPLPRMLPLADYGRGLSWVQADLRLAPGNSGGPIADALGRVVGIAAMIVGGLALAVPSDDVRTFLTGRRPVIGVTVEEIRLREAGQSGLRVKQVAPSSAAAQAGIEAGDILVAAAGAPVAAAADLARVIARTGRDGWLTVELLREGRWQRCQVLIGGVRA